MMCDNLSLYKTYIPSSTSLPSTQSTTITSQFYPIDNNEDEHQSNPSLKRKLSDYEDTNPSLTTLEHVSPPFDDNNSDDEDDDEDDDDDDDDDEGSSGEEETMSDEESNTTHSITTPCTITQRRHSDTIHSSSLSYGTPIVKRRCTYSSMYDDEQKRSVLVESYRKLRGVKKPKLQVSLLICNLIKRLEKTFTKTPPPLRQPNQQQHVQYYQHRTTYRSSSSDSLYMSTSLGHDEIETTTLTPLNQQYSPPHSSNYDSDKVLLPVGDLRSSSMYHPSTTDAYWLAQSNFAIPVVSTSDDDDVDVSLQGGGDYLDLSDNTLASSFSSCSSSTSLSVSASSSSSTELISTSTSISNECCCSPPTLSPTVTKLLVDTNNNNNNNNNNDDYYIYHHHSHPHHHHPQLHSNQDLYSHHHHHHHHHSSTSEQAFFYHHHNGNNTVDIITTA